MSDRPETPLLDQVNYPADIRQLEKSQLPQLSDELRAEMIEIFERIASGAVP